ncbi:sugar-binding transcriptional regulator [Acetobacteraceae bacterium H6797]|nr:sugar-binding transcriptional regulator [Acetobacteraceae bacterium H6797]
MYYVEDMTQTAIAEALGIGRVTVVRMLADARELGEVKISLSREIAQLRHSEIALEQRFGLREAVVAPMVSRADADPLAVIGAATGEYLSGFMAPDMKIGVGWGRTLLHSLNFIDDKPLANLSIVSLLGGVSAVRKFNPAEFAWQFARLLNASCYLISAPALVDSVETKRALIERCGIGPAFHMADSLDAALISVGSMGTEANSSLFGHFSDADRQSLLAAGAVGNVLYNFYDASGRLVDHPLNQRVMSAPIEALRRTPHRILASGGPEKIEALLGALSLLRPTVLITDEVTAATLLEQSANMPNFPP